jgi:putative ABC transport system ATP-binding protein
MLPMDLVKKLPRRNGGAGDGLLDTVGLADQAHKRPARPPGAASGHRSRSCNDPPPLVADEPTGNLDSTTAEDVSNLPRSPSPPARRWSWLPTAAPCARGSQCRDP